jgi:YD repeat-containing protein
VTTWRSTADFVDEINVVPPLTLWTGTTATGDAVFTWTNSYDSQGRLTGFTSIQVGGTITVRYTAWDASGRPTTGTMTGPASTSTLALAYDNAGRTLTTTTTTNGLVGVIVQTFDANGNSTVSQSTITGGLPSTTTTTIQSTTKVCK